MRTREQILEELKGILMSADPNGSAVIENCTENSRLVEDFGFTSIAVLYMIIAIEETFGVRFDNVGMAEFVTLKDVIDYIEAHQ